MTAARTRVIVLAALLCGAATVAVVLASDRADADVAWAVFGPIVIWSFVGTGLYASRHRPGEPHRRADRAARLRVVRRPRSLREPAAPCTRSR